MGVFSSIQDDDLVRRPTPLMFEAPRSYSEPNGLILTPQTLAELPQALGVDPQTPPAQIEVGTVLVVKEELATALEPEAPDPRDANDTEAELEEWRKPSCTFAHKVYSPSHKPALVPTNAPLNERHRHANNC